MEKIWHISMLGEFVAHAGDTTVSQFYSRKAGALLARLALYSDREHAREELVELFWPDVEMEAGRVSLRAALASLRRQFELPGMPAGTIIIADRNTVRINRRNITVDADLFETAVQVASAHTIDPEQRLAELERAVRLYRGELLPGYFDDWIIAERQRLADSAVESLGMLSRLCSEQGDLPRALEMAHRNLRIDPLNEEAHCTLIELYIQNMKPDLAIRQYNELARILREQLDTDPSEIAQALQTRAADLARSSSGGLQPLFTTLCLPGRIAPRSDDSSSVLPFQGSAVSLPISSTSFIGRESEIEWLRERLRATQPLGSIPKFSDRRSSGIITLTGMGGVGKTRIALELAHCLSEEFNGSVYFVDLTGATDITQAQDKLLAAFSLNHKNGAEPIPQLKGILRKQPTLLILDNFEQLLIDESCAVTSTEFIRAIVNGIPQLRCLITSRQPLNIEGEIECQLSPLAVPQEHCSEHQLLECAAIKLFVDRAQRSRADFQLTPRNAAAILELCCRLEGSPLAIELAAAWVRVMTPSQILRRLPNRFDILISKRRDVPARHRSLLATIEWSYLQLSLEQQLFFCCLSVFQGAFSLEAAAAVTGAKYAADQLYLLCERSLLVSDNIDKSFEETRFRLLESLREFALLQITAKQSEMARERHSQYYYSLIRELCQKYAHPDAGESMDRLESEHSNLLAALEWEFDENAPDRCTRIVHDLDWFWYARGYAGERNRWGQRVALAAEKCTDQLLPHALLWSIRFRSDAESQRICERCLVLFRQCGDTSGVADTLYRMAEMAITDRQFATAKALLQESLELHKGIGNTQGVNASRAALAFSYTTQGNYTQARTLLEEQLSAQRTEGDLSGAAKVLVALGNMDWRQGLYDSAERRLEESIGMFERAGHCWGLADGLRNLGNVRRSAEKYDEAEVLLRRSLDIFKSIVTLDMICFVEINLGELALARGDIEKAMGYGKTAILRLRGTNSNHILVEALNLVGASHVTNNYCDAALKYHLESLSLAEESRDAWGVAWCSFHLGAAQLGCGKIAESESSLNVAAARADALGLVPLLRLLAGMFAPH